MKEWLFDNFVSLLALCVSFIAIWLSYKANKKTIEIEESRDEERKIENKKAKIKAKFITDFDIQGIKSKFLLIENTGYSEAKNVEITVDGINIREHKRVLSVPNSTLTIGQGTPIKFIFFQPDNANPYYDIIISWEDESGETGNYHTILTCL